MQIERYVQPQDIGFIALGVVIGAVAVVAVNATCEADLAMKASRPLGASAGASAPNNPFDEELARCRALPIEQAGDPKCRALWAEQRRRFFGPSAEPAADAPKPLDMFPTEPRALEKPAPAIAPKTLPAPKPSQKLKSE